MTYCSMGHGRIGSYGNRQPQYIISTGLQKVEEYSCGVASYNKGKRKIYIHIAIKCANCGENHTANFPYCTLRQKADIEARKEKKKREKGGIEKT